MAFLIEQYGFIKECSDVDSNQKTAQICQRNADSLIKNIQFLLKYQKSLSFSNQSTQEQIKIFIRYTNLFNNISLILKIYSGKPYKHVQISAGFLNNDQKLLLLQTRQGCKLAYRYLNNLNTIQSIILWNICVNAETGQIKVQWPSIKISILNTNQKALYYIIYQSILKKDNLLFIKSKIDLIIDQTNQNPKYFIQEFTTKNNDCRKKLSKISNYIQNSTLFVNLVKENSDHYHQFEQNAKKQQKTLIRIVKNIVQFDKNYKNLKLFAQIEEQNCFVRPSQSKNTISIQNSFERQLIRLKIQLPTFFQVSKNENTQNYHILNHIQLKNQISQENLIKIQIGGFTSIFYTEIQYWNVISIIDPQNRQLIRFENYQKHRQPYKKMVVLKKQNTKINPNIRNRVEHEINILKQIKNGFSFFVPKYYLLVDEYHQKNKKLLIDFIPFPNLAVYMELNQSTMSINTKIYMILIICQGLRYLQQYKIAHLDLKPSNVMLNSFFALRIIDFGQAYHPIFKGRHQPGYSVPYSPPENYKSSKTFDQKNDVFSLGIIIHELFFQSFPYYFYSNQMIRQVYLSGDFQQFWFCSPEEKLNYGQKDIIHIMYQIMAKCLRYHPEERPELEWISLAFIQLLELTYI